MELTFILLVLHWNITMQQTSKKCKRCGKWVLANRADTEHLLHFFITLLTCGLWIFVWAACAIKIGGWRCSICGKKV